MNFAHGCTAQSSEPATWGRMDCVDKSVSEVLSSTRTLKRVEVRDQLLGFGFSEAPHGGNVLLQLLLLLHSCCSLRYALRVLRVLRRSMR